MRKRIDLYIGGNLVDTDEQTYILLNYAFEDFSNPTAVLNSYTQQVTLPGTQRNNALFGELFRTDRSVAAGVSMGSSFDPLRKTEFSIFDEDGTVLQAGYIKLDGVERKGFVSQYKVTLYGSLGSFLYGLTYDGNGDKRTLASLDFLATGASESELSFPITAANVQAAWADLLNPSIPKWSVINFAPCYNGIPEGEFSADKGIFTPGTAGLPSSSGSYDAANTSGYALGNLPRTFDEWEVKDLRSYLQRPVVSMDAVMQAMARAENNGGWTLDYNDVQGDLSDLWMTLPLLPSLGTYKQGTGSLTTTMSSTFVSGPNAGSFAVNGSVPSGTKQAAHLRFKVGWWVNDDMPSVPTASMDCQISATSWYSGVVYIQVAAYNSGTFLAKSKIRVYSRLAPYYTPMGLAQYLGVPNVFRLPGFAWDEDNFEPTIHDMSEFGGFDRDSANTYISANHIQMDLDVQDADEYRVYILSGTGISVEENGRLVSFTQNIMANTVTGYLYDPNDYNTYSPITLVALDDDQSAIDYTTPSSVRSGAIITKAMLLGGTATPADYLVGLCKMFGWQLICDAQRKEVKVVRRNDFFVNKTIDLTERVDTTETVSLTPFAFTAKWYEFKHPIYMGAFAEEYKSAEARDYGIQRVNTGYEFDAATVDLLNGTAFRSAVPVLEKSPCFYSFVVGANKYPSPFRYAGNSYTLQNASGETKDIDITALDDTIIAAGAPVNEYGHDGYDSEWAWKVQLHKADGKPTEDGSGILLKYVSDINYPYYKVSDDVAAMTKLNGGACWDLDLGSGAGITIPLFGRYTTDGQWTVQESLDFGLPAQADIPYINYDAATTLYARKWRKYLVDRYDRNTKVMRCKVRLDGMKVGPELLRQFYWWRGSIWVLNKITNHSLTGFATTECEFVQVQDKDNYLNGQM